MLLQSHSLAVLALGSWPAVESSIYPREAEHHQCSALVISTQTQHRSGIFLLRTSILATFYMHRELHGAQLYMLNIVFIDRQSRYSGIKLSEIKSRDCPVCPPGILSVFKFRTSLDYHVDITIDTFYKQHVIKGCLSSLDYCFLLQAFSPEIKLTGCYNQEQLPLVVSSGKSVLIS